MQNLTINSSQRNKQTKYIVLSRDILMYTANNFLFCVTFIPHNFSNFPEGRTPWTVLYLGGGGGAHTPCPYSTPPMFDITALKEVPGCAPAHKSTRGSALDHSGSTLALFIISSTLHNFRNPPFLKMLFYYNM